MQYKIINWKFLVLTIIVIIIIIIAIAWSSNDYIPRDYRDAI